MEDDGSSGGYVTLQTSRATPESSSSGGPRRLDHITSSSSAMAPPGSATTAAPPAAGTAGAASGDSGEADYRIVSLPQRLPAQPAFSADAFCSNVVITSKYTAWSFLPLFMIESFQKLANAYFLLVSVLQCIGPISNTGGLPTNLPVLMFILAVDGVLAIVEDRRRHRADREANSAQCQVVTATYTGDAAAANLKRTDDPKISVINWSELTVGTVVKLRNRETAPADLLILAVDEPKPSEPNGLCYVETKSLDGETNLKLRHACDATMHALTVAKVQELRGFLRCEQPNRVIGRFDGTLSVASSGGKDAVDGVTQQPVAIKNILLRGCQLRNTEWIYGLVINTGPDTKIMQSAAKPRPKWSSINEMVNKMIIWLFILLCALCAVATTFQLVWLHHNKADALYPQDYANDAAQWFVGFGRYFLLMYQMIPVSLYVTISMVMFIQAIFMVWDVDMYYADLDVRMIVRSLGLNEELGQISYVFSDKTGTLTCNVMEFRKCSINGISYGTGTTEIGRAALRRKGVVVPEDPSPSAAGKKKFPYVNFEDPRLSSKLEKGEHGCLEAEFFLHLGLCHTVIPEKVEGSDEVRLSASSPDEQALVSGAKYFGFSFESRGLGIARVRISNKSMMTNKNTESELVEYKILDVLEFTSDRKRMSVIVQYPNGENWILTKGADNMIFPLLSKSKNHPDLLRETSSHLESFGDDGLRTLTIARRRIEISEYEQWSVRFKAANSSLEEIDKRKNGKPNQIDALMSEIEKELVLLGATAIEDKLQQHVPRAIANLMRASMKVWMLTGDKQETAINISYACQLMDNDMKQIILNMDTLPTKEKLYSYLMENLRSDTGEGKQRKAVVIDGECLEVTLLDDGCREAFLKLAMSCEAVVCCRVSPSQKAEVVSLVRSTNKRARTLAIGDGANDVAMIQRAHVGVGICGQEGMQAVNSSDYAIGQFYFLEKLLLHHGRLNYKRMSILVGYMFYKNIVMVLAQYFYMYSTGISGQKFYSELGFQMYNLAYTSLPIIVLGVFDYDVPWDVARKFPELYQVGPRMELFNTRTFMKWIASAVFESGMIIFFVLYGFNENLSNMGSASMVQYGLLTFTLVVLVCNLKLIMLQMSWTAIGAVCWFVGVLAYLPTSIIVSSYWVALFPTDFGSFQNTLLHEAYWLVIPVAAVASLGRNFAFVAFQRRFYPEPWQIIQERFVLSKSASPGEQSYRDLEVGEANDSDRAYQAVEEVERVSQMPSERKKRVSSGFAFSYDPQTTAAESYMASHSVSSASSAMTEAESRRRVSREDSRASDFGELHSDRVSDNSSNARPRSSSTGLFV